MATDTGAVPVTEVTVPVPPDEIHDVSVPLVLNTPICLLPKIRRKTGWLCLKWKPAPAKPIIIGMGLK